jgi:putative heme-binding domain-containing protein
VRFAEPFLSHNADLQRGVLRSVDDVDAAVQLQTACALGEWHDRRAADALSRLALRHAHDQFFMTGLMSSLNRENVDVVLTNILSEQGGDVPESLIGRLLNAAVLLESNRALATVFSATTSPNAIRSDRAIALVRLGAIWQSLDRMGKTFDRLKGDATPEMRASIDQMEAMFSDARNRLRDASERDAVRIAATKVMGLREREMRSDAKALAGTLVPQNSSALQIAAIDRLGALKRDEVPELLLQGWKSHRPSIRDRIVEILLRRESWARALLNAVEKRMVAASEIEAVQWQELLNGSEPPRQRRIEKILAGLIDPNRQKVLEKYRAGVTQAGDLQRGKTIFATHCATCHKLGGMGQNVGPDLASRKDKSSQSLLIALLDPNRSVEPKYVAYVAVTSDGRTYNGILADESAEGLALVGAKGERVELRRAQIEELTSTGRSLMPDGLEKDLSPQAIADVISYIQGFDAPASGK